MTPPNQRAPRAIIDFVNPDPSSDGGVRRAFGEPLRIHEAANVAQVRAMLDRVEAEARAGRWCVGFVAYEAAPAFDPALRTHAPDGPLAWFAVYDDAAAATFPAPGEAGPARAEWAPAPCGREEFDAAIATILRAIRAGDCYQVNHTARLAGRLREGGPLGLFAALRRAQPGGYAAYVDTGPMQLLSVSPELFFDWRDGRLLARPMKGTAPRGAAPDEDAANARALRASEKERAENVMIVDLLRNDLSRVALPHTVRVPRLFDLQPLSTVWQMTSDVTARTRPDTRLSDVFAALFPCGSVTGAPKVRAMQLIRALEPDPRGAYCGAIGVVRPGGAATFNIGIRTVTVEGERLRCGVGSGITDGSTADGEWREWRHKRAFLDRASAPFELLETLAMADGRLRHVELHLARMARAAAHFGFPWDPARVSDGLDRLCAAHPSGLWRVRLLLDARGVSAAQAFPMAPEPQPVRLAIADRPFEAADSEFVRFKTTRRAHYDAFAPIDPTGFDTILWNARGEITECTRGNLAVLLDGRWVTPPLACGLLDGVGRQVALAEGRIHEGIVRVDDLTRARALAFVNSLRGWLAATLA